MPHAVVVPPCVAVRVHALTAEDLGVALVPWPIELGDGEVGDSRLGRDSAWLLR